MINYTLSDGQTIAYDSHTNSLYNQNGDLLSLPQQYSDEYYEEDSRHHGVDTKSNTPFAIRLVLGHACNYSCSYCMQKDIGNPTERKKNHNIDNFKNAIEDNLELSKLRRVELWGGEPFLYWDDIQEIINFFDGEGIDFFISTNGSALRQKHVDFFAGIKGTISMSISHDGPGQEKLRGDEILNKINVVNTITQLMSLPNVGIGFSSVVSRENSDLFAIHDFFQDFARRNGIDDLKLTYIPAKNYDATNSQNSADFVIDSLGEFDVMLSTFLKAITTNPENFLKTNLNEGVSGVTSVARFMAQQQPITHTSSCGADSDDVLSLDMDGKIRLCPHTDESYIAGDLEDIGTVQIAQLDLDKADDHCYKCPYKRLCKHSCPIKFPDETFLTNCRFEKVWWGNIQKSAIELLFKI